MYFTNDDITFIIKALEKRGYLNSPPSSNPIVNVSGKLTDVIDNNTRVAVGNDLGNFHIYIKDWISSISSIINIDRLYNVTNSALVDVIEMIPSKHRYLGLIITFTNVEKEWVIYQYIGKNLEDSEWLDINNWYNIK